MEEKTIIEAKFEKNKIANILLVIAMTLIGIGLLVNLILDSWIIDYGFYNIFISPEITGTWIMYPGYIIMIPQFIFRALMSGCALTITNKKVTGKASFKKQVDLPLSQISSVGLGLFSSLSIGTSSGRISFWLINNREEIYKAISDLLVNRESQNTDNKEKHDDSCADELKKFKDLLDMGAITQEEFEAKKQQLLNL